MGQDLLSLITRLRGNDKYHLFQREQVVVLLSCTHYTKDIIFVGDPEQTAEALAQLLDQETKYSEYMDHLLEKLTNKSGNNSAFTIDIP